MGIWPWNKFAQLRQERDEALALSEMSREASRGRVKLLRQAYFRDPDTGRMCRKGVVPPVLLEQIVAPQNSR